VVEVDAGGGGIQNVGRSLMKLLAAKQRDGLLDYRVTSLRGPTSATGAEELRAALGQRFEHFDGRRAAFSASVLSQMVAWADVVIFMHMGIASLLALIPRWLRPISLTWIYGVEVWSPRNLRHRLGLARTDRVVSTTEFTMHKALEANPWLPLPRPCHLGIPQDETVASVDATAELGFAPRPHDILIVGRLAKGEGRKGHDQLIAAMRDVSRTIGDARLVVAGTGDNLDFYREMARREGVDDRVIFTGFVDQPVLEELYRRCGVFAMPSRQEGFGLVYLEAMRAGLPCIASDCDAAQEIVVDGETGYLVAPDDRTALTTALTRLLGNDALRRELGRQARARFLQSFTEAHFQERVWALLSEAMVGHGVSRRPSLTRIVEHTR
jgi:phosphatidylinositol alpha-1,6-mannosyltransferase